MTSCNLMQCGLTAFPLIMLYISFLDIQPRTADVALGHRAVIYCNSSQSSGPSHTIYWYKMPDIKTTMGRGADGILVIDITNMKQFGSYICCISHPNGVSECSPEAKVNRKGKVNISYQFNSKTTSTVRLCFPRLQNHVHIFISIAGIFLEFKIIFIMSLLLSPSVILN